MFCPYLKSCALHCESSDGTRGAADDSVCILGKRESKEEPISFMPKWKNSSEDFRDTEIVALIQISMRQILYR